MLHTILNKIPNHILSIGMNDIRVSSLSFLNLHIILLIGIIVLSLIIIG
jgi:hypothetical protein